VCMRGKGQRVAHFHFWGGFPTQLFWSQRTQLDADCAKNLSAWRSESIRMRQCKIYSNLAQNYVRKRLSRGSDSYSHRLCRLTFASASVRFTFCIGRRLQMASKATIRCIFRIGSACLAPQWPRRLAILSEIDESHANGN